MVVRAVDIHEPFAKRREDIQGGGRTVDELAVHAVGSESALQEELPVLTRFKPVFVEKLLEWRAELGNIKNRLDRATVAAAADQRAVSSFAEHQIQRADQDRFAGAGLAGDGVVAGLQFKRQVGDQSEVLDAQRRQHGEIVRAEFGDYGIVRQKNFARHGRRNETEI